jgi:hypothetical protein
MFYEDVRIGHSLALGDVKFSRKAILAYGRLFDSRIVAQAADAGTPLAASGLHVAAAGMRRLVDTRSALRAAMAKNGEVLSKRATSKPKWGGQQHISRRQSAGGGGFGLLQHRSYRPAAGRPLTAAISRELVFRTKWGS